MQKQNEPAKMIYIKRQPASLASSAPLPVKLRSIQVPSTSTLTGTTITRLAPQPIRNGTSFDAHTRKMLPTRIQLVRQPIRAVPVEESRKATWQCRVCEKELSSKRSYTEHMNIHNRTRPFACEYCEYAAASQMTLHRHKLRSHTPRSEWGYRCPYCLSPFMEPASYQQHVQSRHIGLSATYGCPYVRCVFTSKSQRHFREHISKHACDDKFRGDGRHPNSLPEELLIRYLINDECGSGYIGSDQNRKVTLARPIPLEIGVSTTLQQPRRSIIGVSDHFSSGREPIKVFRSSSSSESTVIRIDGHGQRYCQRVVLQRLKPANDRNVMGESDDEGPPVLEQQQQQQQPLVQKPEVIHSPDHDWIEAEIEVSSNTTTFPNGLIDDELD